MNNLAKPLKHSVCAFVSISAVLLHAETEPAVVEINLNVRHEVGGLSTFDREKFITVHSTPTEEDWGHTLRDSRNFTENLFEDFMIGRDVYFGRDTGYINLHRKHDDQIGEDPERTGWVDAKSMERRGRERREEYKKNTGIHHYEERNKTGVMCAQYHAIWPNGAEVNGWAISTEDSEEEPFGSASGDFMGRFLKEFYDDFGQRPGPSSPPYVEIVNEPDWYLLEWPHDPDYGSVRASKLWEFHVNVAQEVRKHQQDILIGGYVSFNPKFDEEDFGEWKDEWKLFVDIAGEEMDFWSLHLYDQPAMWHKTNYRKGANLEAMFDLIDYYSEAALGEARPYVISEFGSQTHEPHNDDWTAHRDWLRLKAMSSMTLTFLERPHLMLKTIPYITLKAEWGRNQKTDVPWHARLMRQSGEPGSYTGEWVYTELIHYYDLWADVNGERVYTASSDPDIQVDSYVDGNKAYLILNNIVPDTRVVDLSFLEQPGQAVTLIRSKHLYWEGDPDGGRVVFDEAETRKLPKSVTIESEAAMVLELTYPADIEFEAALTESKYFASTYLQPIHKDRTLHFIVPDVAVGKTEDATLRIGIAREHELSKQPTVVLNGETLQVPADIMGYEKDGRFQFFGTLLIPVSTTLLQEENRVELTFPDSGGQVSTIALQVLDRAGE
ncbi:MAG: agarase [Lentimonas sp.]